MLVVYSGNGSPGASTTAMYLAAQWASTGTEVLLLEADPAGGSLSHHLGIQFTPGLASFMAAGLEIRGSNLIDHSQDVLFNNLHVMPSTSSPTGARQIVEWLGRRAGEFRAVAEDEMAVIIDGGRLNADSAAGEIAAHAAGVVVVARGDGALTSLEHIGDLLSAEVCGEGVERCVVTIGDSPLSAEDWHERCGITYCGAVMEFEDAKGDLSAFLNRNKRKSKKWRTSLERAARELLPYAKPPASGASRPPRAEPEPAEESAPAAADPQPLAGSEPGPGDTYETAPPAGYPPHGDPAAGQYGEAPPPQPYYPPPPAGYPAAPGGYPAYPLEEQSVYVEPTSPPPDHSYYDAPLPVYDPPQPQHAPPPGDPAYGLPPEQHLHEPHGVPAPGWTPAGYPEQPRGPSQGYEYPPPAQHPPQGHAPPEHAPPPYPEYPQEPHPSDFYRQPPAPGSEPREQQPSYPPAVAQQPPQASPPHQQVPPYPAQQPAAEAPPPEPEITPSGSFRDWAARLHGQAPHGTSTHGHGGVS